MTGTQRAKRKATRTRTQDDERASAATLTGLLEARLCAVMFILFSSGMLPVRSGEMPVVLPKVSAKDIPGWWECCPTIQPFRPDPSATGRIRLLHR